jgi:hypothetical protein
MRPVKAPIWRKRNTVSRKARGALPPPELISVLVATDPPLVTGGSVISVPPRPSEVALKFDTV